MEPGSYRHVQITVAEGIGVEERGKFSDATGALRDMVPNHLFQLLTLIAIEPPTCFGAEAVRSEKIKVLDAVNHVSPKDARHSVVRGQYDAGVVNGREIVPYRRDSNVAPNSRTETYVRRWAGCRQGESSRGPAAAGARSMTERHHDPCSPKS